MDQGACGPTSLLWGCGAVGLCGAGVLTGEGRPVPEAALWRRASYQAFGPSLALALDSNAFRALHWHPFYSLRCSSNIRIIQRPKRSCCHARTDSARAAVARVR